MRLSRIYSNQPEKFPCIDFRDGLNVVLGEIRLPENRNRDTHNLGKTILSQVIDFCLMRKKTAGFFLFKYEDLFGDFVFFLELRTQSEQFVTIRRAVETGSTASFKTMNSGRQEFASLDKDDWDHWNLPFDRAKSLLDSYLKLDAVAPWTFRNAIAYSLRTQKDYDEPFKLAKYGGRHADWKPFLAHILGLDASLISKNYDLAEEIARLESRETSLAAELGDVETLDQIRGLLEIRRRELKTLETDIERYNFDIADAEINRELVDELDATIAELNEERYYVSTNIKRIQDAMSEHATLDMRSIRENFEQAKIYFGDQIKKDYSSLESFNKALSEERDEYLGEELRNAQDRITEIAESLESLNRERASALLTLKDAETFSKYKRLTDRLVTQRTDLELLKRKEESVKALRDTQTAIRKLSRERSDTQEKISENIDVQQSDGLYSNIRAAFDEIVSSVIGQHANLYSKLNSEGNVDFRIHIVDNQGRETDAAQGYTYGRLLCIAFDMAIMAAYSGKAYPHFIYHDGALESLDDRKKLNLIDAIRRNCRDGIQHIVTVIDSELPACQDGTQFEFDDDELVLTLHDEGDSGRLFRMPQW